MDLAVESVDAPPPAPDAAFYFDVGDPECWLAAERVITTLGRPAPWIPVLASELPSGVLGGDSHAAWTANLQSIATTADERGLLPLRAPDKPQTDSREAMLATTYARQSGKIVAFTLALMRQCWCAGRALDDRDTIALAGAAAEIHPNALAKALGMRSLAAQLHSATSEAVAAGVTSVPAVRIGSHVFHGDGGIDEAATEILA